MTIAEVRLANTNLNFNHRYDAWIEYENTFVGFTFLKAIRWRESMGFFETKMYPTPCLLQWRKKSCRPEHAEEEKKEL